MFIGPGPDDKFLIPTLAALMGLLIISVTRFGEISPPWLKYKSLGHFSGVYLGIRENVVSTLGNWVRFWVNVQCCIWPNIEQII